MTPLLSCRVSGHPVPHTLYGTNNCFRINWVIHAIFLVFFSEGFKYVLLYIMHFKCSIVPCTIGLNVHVKCILQQTASKRFLPLRSSSFIFVKSMPPFVFPTQDLICEGFTVRRLCRVSLDTLGKQTQPALGRIKAASQSEFRTLCAVTRGNLFAQILSKQTQTC